MRCWGETEDDKEIALLNRTLIWTSGSITFEADPKHVRGILSYFNFDSTSKGLRAPIVKETKEEVTEEEVELGPYVATEVRGLAARANYLSLGRPDIQFATKEICREMAKPTERGMLKMKRLARYLLQLPVLFWSITLTWKMMALLMCTATRIGRDAFVHETARAVE